MRRISLVQFISGAGIYGRYGKSDTRRNHCCAGHHCEKGIADTDFLRCIPGGESECDDTGNLFQIHEEKIWRRKKNISDEPACIIIIRNWDIMKVKL